MITSTKHHKIGLLEFVDKFDRLVEGEIFKIEIEVNPYQTNIVYHIKHLDRDLSVDGDTFREIY